MNACVPVTGSTLCLATIAGIGSSPPQLWTEQVKENGDRIAVTKPAMLNDVAGSSGWTCSHLGKAEGASGGPNSSMLWQMPIGLTVEPPSLFLIILETSASGSCWRSLCSSSWVKDLLRPCLPVCWNLLHALETALGDTADLLALIDEPIIYYSQKKCQFFHLQNHSFWGRPTVTPLVPLLLMSLTAKQLKLMLLNWSDQYPRSSADLMLCYPLCIYFL